MKPEIEFIEGYLYSIWNGTLTVYKGVITVRRSPYRPNKPSFASFSNESKNIGCSPIPGKVYNGVVWLHNKSDNIAIEALVKNQTKQIEDFHNKIEGCRKRIEIILGEIKDET